MPVDRRLRERGSSHHMLMVETKWSDDWKLWPIEPCADPLFDSGVLFYVSKHRTSGEIWRWELAHSRALRLWHDLVSSMILSRQVQNICFLHCLYKASWIPNIVAQCIACLGITFLTSALLWCIHNARNYFIFLLLHNKWLLYWRRRPYTMLIRGFSWHVCIDELLY